MFYESERIIRKQRGFINMKALELICNFESRGLKDDEILAALDLSIRGDSNTELRVDTISTAILILNSRAKDEAEG